MSGSFATSDILVVVDRGEQYNLNIQPPDQYGISIQSGDTYIVNIDLPTTIVDTGTTTYYRVADYANLAATASFFGGVSASVDWPNITNKPSGLVSSSTQIDYTNISNIPTGILSSSTQINELSNVSASFATTSSYALNAGSGVGFPFSGSAVITGSLLVSGGSIIGTSSLAQQVRGGKSRYVPLWTGSSENELTSSIIYQTNKGIFIGYDTTAHFHSAEGETLAVHSGETGVKNVIYAHGTIDDDYRVNIRNISSGVSASTNFKATADVGNDVGGFVELGINSSTYARADQIGGPLDAYLFTTGSDLLIGNLSPDKRIILFTGPGDADNNARIYIDPSGSVGINTSEVIANAPDALRVKAVPYTSTYNVITALGLTDDYAQINMKNTGVGNSVSSDIVATANNGDENTNYVNMGINGETYTGTIGGPNDSYVYSTGGHLHLGAIDPSEEVRLFVGGNDTTLTTKLTLRDTNQHELSGSLNVTGSLNVLNGVINNLTASFALTASYVFGAVTSWDNLLNKPLNLVSSSQQVKDFLPSGTVSSSQQAISWTVLSASFASTASNINFTPATASFATSASFAPTNAGVVSSSTQINYTQLQNIPSGIVSSSAQVITLLPTGTVSSSAQINTGSFSGSFRGTLIGTSSWATSASFAVTASHVLATGLPSGIISSSAQVVASLPLGTVSSSTQINTGSFSGSFIGTFTGTSSFAVSSSTAITASYVLPSGLPSGVVSSSAQVVASLPTGTISSSLQINTGSFSGSFTGTFFGTSSWANNSISSSFATTASAATSITFVPSTASFATSASFAPTNAGVVSSSTQIDYTQIQNRPTTIATASFVEYVNVANKPALVSASSQIQLNAITGATFSNASFLFPQNLRVEGTLIAQEIRTEFVTSSIIFESGSTKFGDSADDTHQFTGSLTVLGTLSGSLVLPSGIVSSSAQVVTLLPIGTVSSSVQINTGSFSGSFTGTLIGTSSWATSASFAPTNAGVVSSSTQVNYTQLQNIPVGIVSSSTQVTSLLPTGTVSSSAQINTGSFSGSFTGTFFGTSSWASNSISSSFATTASVATSITFTPTTASFAISSSRSVSSSTAISASYSFTASYIDGGFY